MRQFGRWLRVPVLAAVGAVPGILLAYFAENWGFLGVALLGGLAGFGLGVTGLVYRTSLLGSIRRVFKGMAFTLVEYNVGLGRALTRVDQEPAIESLLPTTTGRAADFAAYDSATYRGVCWGAGLGAIAGFVLGWWLDGDKPIPNRLLTGGVLAMLGVLVGLVYGWAIGALTVPGRHRPRIAIGFLAGMVLGCGPVMIAYGMDGHNSVPAGWLLFAVFASLGLGAGTFAKESEPDDPG